MWSNLENNLDLGAQDLAKNERITENIVREMLRAVDFYDVKNDIQVEEQKSTIEGVRKLLRAASKSGGGGIGAPEFIISSASTPDFVLIVECKASVNDHESSKVADILGGVPIVETDVERIKRIQRYAVDGVLHYAKALSKDFSVITVSVSGDTASGAVLSTHLWPRGMSLPKVLHAKTGAPINAIISWKDYIEHATFDPSVQKLRFDELMAFASELHDFMRDHAKLTESEKPLLVSGTLIALRNTAFAKSFGFHDPAQLQKEWMSVIQKEIKEAEIPKAKIANMTQPYSSIAVHPELGKEAKGYPKGILHELIKRLNDKVWPFISVYHDFDVVGQFYGEFLKYTGGDKKALGIVLTPRHVTELFAYIANVNKDSTVLDTCAGTGGFLISAMHQMFRDAATEKDVARIREEGLIGIEQQPNMFALAASNMILRGDGKANLYQGSCFDPAITDAVKGHNCDVGMINPPYSQADTDLQELRFVKHMLDCLTPGGIGIAIVPMSCALNANPMRAEILRTHTLEAVMSMPDELFYPVSAVTCIMVFTAHKAHAKEDRDTWFGYWKRDGFLKTKKGRIDVAGTWEETRKRWIDAYKNRKVVPGESVMKKVDANSEWCAEAYMETDYSVIDEAAFKDTVRAFVVSQLVGPQDIDLDEVQEEDLE